MRPGQPFTNIAGFQLGRGGVVTPRGPVTPVTVQVPTLTTELNKPSAAKDDMDNVSQASKFAPSINSAFKPLRKSVFHGETSRPSAENSTPNEGKAVAVTQSGAAGAEMGKAACEDLDRVCGKLDFQKILKEEGEPAAKHSQDSNDLRSARGEDKN